MAHNGKKDMRGLASAPLATRKRVASAGGRAPHRVRGKHGRDHNIDQ